MTEHDEISSVDDALLASVAESEPSENEGGAGSAATPPPAEEKTSRREQLIRDKRAAETFAASTTAQAAALKERYPWRGRITKDFNTADKSPKIATEIAAFVKEYRQFVLHYATLCAEAGGVNVFLLGSELRGLTWLRDAEGSYPLGNLVIEEARRVDRSRRPFRINFHAQSVLPV